MLVGEVLQFKRQGPGLVEALVQKTVKAAADGTLEFQDEVVIEGLDVTAGETAVNGVVPDKEGARELEAPLLRVGFGPAAFVLLGVNLDALQDVEFLVHPLVSLLFPPGVLVVEGDANPAIQGLVDAVVALTIDGPAEEFDELVPAEKDSAVLELLKLAELEKS